jgi:hypothetical protein
MPVIRNYLVNQTREVEVRANSLVDAIRIADAAFANGQNSDNGIKNIPEELHGIWGNTTSGIREVDISARENY